ncbi:MAG: hypothetical protein AAGH57_06420 [Pseudomonadota bacterium]
MARDSDHRGAYGTQVMAAIAFMCARFRAGLLALLAAGLWLNTLAPVGYMVAPGADGWLAVTPCPATHPLARQNPDTVAEHAAMGHAHAAQHGGHHSGLHSGPDGAAQEGDDDASTSPSKPCASGGVTKLATGPIDPALLLVAIAFAMLLALTLTARPTWARATRLRPPPRGPPVPA